MHAGLRAAWRADRHMFVGMQSPSPWLHALRRLARPHPLVGTAADVATPGLADRRACISASGWLDGRRRLRRFASLPRAAVSGIYPMKLSVRRLDERRYETVITRDDGVRFRVQGVAHIETLELVWDNLTPGRR
jgi:hypothetical protein